MRKIDPVGIPERLDEKLVGANSLANLKSSKKDIRRTITRNLRNSEDRSEIRTYAKQLLKAVKAGNKEEALHILTKYSSRLDKAAKTKLIHKNNASRHKSRMAKRVNKIA